MFRSKESGKQIKHHRTVFQAGSCLCFNIFIEFLEKSVLKKKSSFLNHALIGHKLMQSNALTVWRWELTSCDLRQSVSCVISRETEANIGLDLSCGCSSLCMCVKWRETLGCWREYRPAPHRRYSNKFDSPCIKCKAAWAPVCIYESTMRMTGQLHKLTCSCMRWQDNIIDWMLRNMC